MTRSARYHARRRTAVLTLLGGACEECFTRDAALEIDHVHSTGHAERRTYGHAEFISRILRNERDERAFGPLQLLCPPCHTEKTLSVA